MAALTAMRPFNVAPDLLQDARIINDFLSQGMAGFEALALHFGLENDAEGAMQLGIALQAYASQNMELATRTLMEFGILESHIPVLARVVEVLYKVINNGSPAASDHWLKFAVEFFAEHKQISEAQRLILEFFTYFGLWEHALSIHALLPVDVFEPWCRHIMLSRARAEGFQPRHRFSCVVLTWNRADLLDRCLTEIRAKAGSEDCEIIVGVNASSDHTAQVLEKHAITQVHWNSQNDSIDFYRKLFEAAQGATIIEIDDNVVELPEAFDLILEQHLQIFPEIGYFGFQPTRLDTATGVSSRMDGAAESDYQPIERDGLTIHTGPVWGCCAAITKRDWLNLGGFYGVKLSKLIGEELQIVRKLAMHDRLGALIRGQTLLKAY